MADSKGVAAQIAARCRQIGWDVKPGTGRTAWIWKITPPVGQPVYLHGSPSDTNWEEHVWRKLNKAGFVEAEANYLEAHQAEKAIKQATETKAAEAKAEKLSAQSALLNRAAGPYVPKVADLGWLTTPTPFPETRLIIMTPTIAAKMLEKINTRNRPMRPSRVEFLARVIKIGEWEITHQGGATDSDGNLLDGQHRLAAIVEADQDTPIMWTVGAAPSTFFKVDTVAPRTARDAIALLGGDPLGPSNSVSALASKLIHIGMFKAQAHTKGSKFTLSIDQVTAFVAENRDALAAAINVAKEVKKDLPRGKGNPTSIAAAHFLISSMLDPDDKRVVAFFEDVAVGPATRDKTDPVFLLRRALFHEDTKKGYNAWEQIALIIKAWNYRVLERKNLSVVMWRPTSEPFPQAIMPATPRTTRKAS